VKRDEGPEEHLNEAMAQEAEVMLEEGFIEGLAQQLRRRFPSFEHEADASVGHGVHKLITRCRSPRKPPDYIAACAYNYMKRFARRASLHDSLDVIRGDSSDGVPVEVPDTGWTVEERALIDEVYLELCHYVETWEAGNVRSVTLLFLEATQHGDPLTSEEAADQLGEILGEEIDADFVRVWKSRGFKRLRKWVSNGLTEEGDHDDH
jgi:hypothetical protein